MDDFDHDLDLGTTLGEIRVQGHFQRQGCLACLNGNWHLEDLVLMRVVERRCSLELNCELLDLLRAGVICLLDRRVSSSSLRLIIS